MSAHKFNTCSRSCATVCTQLKVYMPHDDTTDVQRRQQSIGYRYQNRRNDLLKLTDNGRHDKRTEPLFPPVPGLFFFFVILFQSPLIQKVGACRYLRVTHSEV